MPISTTIILVIIYRIDLQLHNMFDLIKQIANLSKINVRIKLRELQISPPLQIYESCRFYCPANAIVFSARFNTHPSIVPLLSSINQSKVCHNQHMIVANHFFAQNNSQSDISPSIRIYDRNRKINLQYFHTHFQHAQIFCSYLVK